MKNNSIMENMPLPKRLSTEWEEIYAKLILEQHLPNHFTNLDYEKEKPDLRNETNDIGIEVTSSMSKAERILDSLYPRDYKNGSPEEKQKAKQTIENLGGVLHENYLIYPTMANNLSVIFSPIQNKLKKLNKAGFKKYRENDLFIFTTTHILEYKHDALRQGIETINNNFDWQYTFDKIFVYCLLGELIYFDSKTKVIEKIPIHNAFDPSTEARNILAKKYKTV